MNIKFFILLTSHFSLLTFVHATPTGAHFLKIPVGARAVGLGSSLTALVDDPTAMYWNPAGLSHARGLDFVATHNVWIAQTNENFAGLSVRVSSSLSAGISYLMLDSGNLERRNDSGALTGSFGARDQVISLAGSYRLNRSLALGVTAKTITQELDALQAKGMAFDFGLIFKPASRIFLGASISNIGQPMKFVNEPYDLPRMGRVGLGWTIGSSLNLVASASQNLNDKTAKSDLGVGLEYNASNVNQSYFWSPVVWRLGYLMPPTPGVGKPAAGVGLKIMGSQIDYAVAAMDDLGFTHRISFRISFGGNALPNTKTNQPVNSHASNWAEQMSNPN